MNRFLLSLLCLSANLHAVLAQPNFTANNTVTAYDQPFGYGANLGNYPPWSNAQVADISFGTGSLPGIGLNTFRGSLPGHFLEAWGYDIRVADYQYFAQLGAGKNLVFVGYPSLAHQSAEVFCASGNSQLFANL